MAAYAQLPPNARADITPFEIHVDEQRLKDFETLLRLSPVMGDTYENQRERVDEGREWGVTREWLKRAKETWMGEFEWRTQESHLNTFPHFTAPITDETTGKTLTIHFVALFSTNPHAIPLARLSGWPCSFTESLPLLSLLMQKHTPETLPYHVIIPSQPGWPFSSPPPLDRDWKYADSARVVHALMMALGFREGYALSGGDIGAGIARIMAATYAEAKVLHTNYAQMPRPEGISDEGVDTSELEDAKRGDVFMQHGTGYGRMQGTRPATLSAVLAASPLAVLAWIGEKYLSWTDPRSPIPLQHILQEASLYWFTGCFATTLYPYREDFEWGVLQKGYLHGMESLFVDKPFGYSYFPRELVPAPRKWVETSARVVWYRRHEVGGHFPALERSEVLLGDVEDFLKEVWK